MDGPPPSVDLNADLGEGYGNWEVADDAGLLAVVTSAHVACGFHAGDPAVMRRVVRLAAASGVALGAHPSYPDLVGFGRRPMEIEPARVADDMLYQLGALEALARAEGARVRSVKPHGALYNRAAVDEECARALAGALLDHGGGLRLVLAAGSPGLAAAAQTGVVVVAEGFCDRRYLPDGSLAPRSEPGAVVIDPGEAARRAVAMAVSGRVDFADGSAGVVRAETLCVHGDTPSAVAMAARVRQALEAAAVTVAAPGPP